MRHLSSYAIVLTIAFSLFVACTSTKYVPVYKTHTDTVRLTHQRLDSVWLHDSIFLNQYVRGDTVFKLQTQWHTRYVSRLVRDTAYVSRRDTISVPYPVEKQVPAKLAWHQQARLWLANIIIIVFAILAAVWLIRKRGVWKTMRRKILN